MKIADLYIRVSTDEQAEKGYSLRSQQDILRRYCELNGIKIRQTVIEDYSAKTFNRPAWKKLAVHLKKHKGKTNLLLFTKWDRFSRNTSDAYQTIAMLNKIGIEPQAIEQPLDLSVPENKMMLAVYLTTPEIENDRRGLSTKAGIRQAKKEGRWTGKAPLGYINKTAETGKKYIAIKEPEASLMKWIFEELATGTFSGEQILYSARRKGLKCSMNNFYTIIRNPVYCGKVIVPRFKNEETFLAQGLHEPLISESMFLGVQEILNGRRKELGQPISTPEALVMRGFLKCIKCHRSLSGSSSKGKNRYFTYYHCTSACGVRFRSEQVNTAFQHGLSQFSVSKGFDEIFSQSVADAYQNQVGSVLEERNLLVKQIQEMNQKMERARSLLIHDEIEAADFRIIKTSCNEKATILQLKLKAINDKNKAVLNAKPIMEKALSKLNHLNLFFKDSSVEGKRYLISCLFPEKLEYDGNQYKVAQLSEIAKYIYSSMHREILRTQKE
ncbi:recombinase family protein [Pedobacter agri]|uniref:recombinase family protein n=1 Tax=Pedobacter agri TaxID=454586 RepID=UPI00292EC815|nr:recombinase family protein [Pedobacter agri]